MRGPYERGQNQAAWVLQLGRDGRSSSCCTLPAPIEFSSDVLTGDGDLGQFRVFARGWLTVLDEILEGRERSRPDPIELVRDDRFEQLPEQAALENDFRPARQECRFAFHVNSPFVLRARNQWYTDALVGEGAPLLPREPPFLDRDAPAEIAGALRSDTLRDRPLTASLHHGFRPELDVREPCETGPHLVCRRFDADGPREVDHVAQYGKSEVEPRLLAKMSRSLG